MALNQPPAPKGWLSRSNTKTTAVSLAVIFSIPFVIYVANPNLFFGNAGTNPWMAQGMYFHYVDAYTFFNALNRQIERIPSVLPGFILYSWFPPLAANFLKFSFFYGISTLSFHYVVRKECGEKAAVLATALFATHSFFLNVVANDYYSNGIVAYGLAAMVAAIAARSALRQTRKRIFLVLCGTLMTAAVFSHPRGVFALLMPPLMYFSYVDFRNRSFLKQVAAVAIWVPSGIALSTGVLSLISYFGLNGPLWFFKLGWKTSKPMAFYQDLPLPFNNPALAVILSSLVAAAVLLATSTRRPFLAKGNFHDHRLALAMLVWLLALAATAAIGIDFLEIPHSNPWIIGPIFLVTGCLFARFTPDLSWSSVYAAAAVVIVLGAVNAALPDPPWGHRLGFALPVIAVTFAFFAALVLCWQWPAAFRSGKGGGAVLICVAMLLALGQATIRTNSHYYKEPWKGKARTYGYDRYVRIYDSMAFLHGFGWKKVPKFWVKSSKNSNWTPGIIEGDLERTFLTYAFFIHPKAFKQPRTLINFPEYRAGFLEEGEPLVIVDGKPGVFGRANEALASHNLKFEQMAARTVSHAGLSHYISYGKIAKLAD